MYFDCNLYVINPYANIDEVFHENGFSIQNDINVNQSQYSKVILALAHSIFKKLPLCKSSVSVLFDVKGILNPNHVDARP